MSAATNGMRLLELDFLHASKAEKLVHARQNIALKHLRKLSVARVHQHQKRAFPAHFAVGVGNLSGQGPVGQIFAHNLPPMDREVSFQTPLSAHTVLQHLGDEPRQSLRLEGTLSGFARSFFAARPASSYIVAQ